MAVYLYALEMVEPTAAQERALQILQEPDKTAPIAVVRAADIVFHARRALTEADVAWQDRQLISVFD